MRGSKLTMLIFVTTRQYSNEFGSALAAPKIFHFSLFTFPLRLSSFKKKALFFFVLLIFFVILQRYY